MGGERLVDTFRKKANIFALQLRSKILLFRSERELKDGYEIGFVSEKAVRQLEEHSQVLLVDRLQMLYEEVGGEDLHEQLLRKKQELSDAQLVALQNLTTRRIEQTLENIKSK